MSVLKNLIKTNCGYGLISFLVYSSLIAITTATILNLIMNFNRRTKIELQKLKSGISADHCFSGILSMTTNSTSLTDLETTRWYNNKRELNSLTTKYLLKTSSLNKIAKDSPILEVVRLKLPILRKEVHPTKIIYSSPLRLPTDSDKEASSNLFMITPWSSLILNVKFQRTNLASKGVKITLLDRPKLLFTFGNLNYEEDLSLQFLTKQHWSAPIKSYGLIYRTNVNNLEYRSLITSDAQPLCENLLEYSRHNSLCTMKVGQNQSEVELRTFACPNQNPNSLKKLNLLDLW